MTVEHGVWIVFMVTLFFAIWGPHFLWRAAGLKLAIDAAAIGLLGVGGPAPVAGLRVVSLLVLCSGTFFLFVFAILGFQFFKARRAND